MERTINCARLILIFPFIVADIFCHRGFETLQDTSRCLTVVVCNR